MKGFVHSASVVIGLCLCIFFVTGCHAHERRRVISLVDLKRSPNFVATVDMLRFFPSVDAYNKPIEECILGIRKQSGEELCIGDVIGPEAKETADFGHTLQVGRTYEFPKAWLEFKQKQKSDHK